MHVSFKLAGVFGFSLFAVAPGARAQLPAAPATAPPTAAPAPVPSPAPEAAATPVPSTAAAEAPPAAGTAGPVVAEPAPVAAEPAPRAAIAEPPPPPPRANDARPNRAKRPFFIGGELGWNGLSGLGVNFSYHPIPYLALDTGLGLALSGARLGLRVRGNLLTSEWTPFVGVGLTYSGSSGGDVIELESSKGEKVKLEILPSAYVQLAGGVNYTGPEGFVFMATGGYAILLDSNTEYASGSREAYDEVRDLLRGGVIVSLAFGYAF